LQHLGLGPNGQPTNLEYYMRFISRAYWIQLEQQPKTKTTRGKRGKAPDRKQIQKKKARKPAAAAS
jgi:hypothetical protein